jgi:hypothetical protein
MKKLIGIIAVLLLFASCGGNDPKYKTWYVGVGQEDQKLFSEEIGFNEEVFLGALAENYTISKGLPITVFERKESELSSSTNDLELDGHMFTLTLTQALHGVAVPEDLDNRIKQIEYQKVFDGNGLCYALNIGSDMFISYLYFSGDQRSYSFLPTNLSSSLQFIGSSNDDANVEKIAADQLVALNMLKCSSGAVQQVLTSFNCKLSNGKTLRVGFLAEKK